MQKLGGIGLLNNTPAFHRTRATAAGELLVAFDTLGDHFEFRPCARLMM